MFVAAQTDEPVAGNLELTDFRILDRYKECSNACNQRSKRYDPR